ncbi:GNAT family N-acetyltransferase [Corynebacterium genitalium ATCC 33030]|uniref:Acetyltransferase, GNAT family n=1 Tax=Corynebacterium genitalium ATCC 33030 TaxID=585529 RepID=D7WFE4_9CORY|nr:MULTISPECIES: GNAT family N-acetyltransferase [Corynebacterium]EFK53771.1 acetyltransferase, GNAT family [Corynebacterium genitalium ATCC 33030]UUA88665.1 GNAT family N-acetyltransferase [Corynebacterium genitalium ATCC 33030]
MLTPLIYAHGGRDSGDVVGAYVFSATLAIQDITGSPYSGVSAAHMAKRLEGSAESEAFLFALTDLQAPRPLGPLGYPEVHVDDLADIAAWVFISLPLLEDTRVIEATVTLDAAVAPVPGSGEPVPREPWVAALSLIDALSASFDRPIRQVWVTHSGEPLVEPELSLTSHGYSAAYHEAQATFSLGAVAAEAAGPGISVVRNMGFNPDDLPSLRALLSGSSRDYPRGDLILDSINWTEQRLRDASARLMDRGGTQLTAVAHAPDGKVIGMAEAVHYDVDDDRLMELGLIYVLPEYRGQGAAKRMLENLLAAAKTEWPKVETAYASYPAESEPAARLLRPLSPEIISYATAWQKHVRKS